MRVRRGQRVYGMEKKEEAVARIYSSYLAAETAVGRKGMIRNPSICRKILRQLQEIRPVPTILVTGSRGKGSVAAMLAAILKKRKRIGLFTGPHIYAFNERIRVDGEEISDADIVRHLNRAIPLFSEEEKALAAGEYVSPMAYQTAAALSYFTEQDTQLNIFECGKGVREDDVGSLLHEGAVMNRIMAEHIPELGENVLEVAQNKACIMENGCKVCFTSAQADDVMAVLKKKAMRMGVSLMEADQAWIRAPLSMKGRYQKQNAALAVLCARYFCPDLTEEEISDALLSVRIPGRMEILSKDPFILFDACMTRESAAEVLFYIRESGMSGITLILGLSDDKDYCGVAEEMREVSGRIILTTSQNPHYRCSPEQKQKLLRRGIDAERIEGITNALKCAKNRKAPIVILALGALRGELDPV